MKSNEEDDKLPLMISGFTESSRSLKCIYICVMFVTYHHAVQLQQ
jgi:hypothetical protein